MKSCSTTKWSSQRKLYRAMNSMRLGTRSVTRQDPGMFQQATDRQVMYVSSCDDLTLADEYRYAVHNDCTFHGMCLGENSQGYGREQEAWILFERSVQSPVSPRHSCQAASSQALAAQDHLPIVEHPAGGLTTLRVL